MFNWEIGFGEIIQVVTILLGGAYFIFNINHKIDSLIVERKEEQAEINKKFNVIETQLGKLVEVSIKLATQDERIKSIDKRFQELYNKVENIVVPVLNGHASKTRRKSSR